MESFKTISAGGVILNPKGEVAVVSKHGISWTLPKGHVKNNESLLETAKREIKEETGLTDLQLVKELGSYERYKISRDPVEVDNKKELKHITIFLFTTPETTLQPIDGGNPQARWVPKHDVANLLTHPKDKEFFMSILNQLP